MVAGRAVDVGAAAYAAILVLWTAWFAWYSVPQYMDEVFHIPQAQQYCAHNFAGYDPLLTTPPGPYALAWLALALPAAALRALGAPAPADPCSVTALRALNALLAFFAFLVLRRLARRSLRGSDPASRDARALALALLPTHFFFAFLFYTDVGGLLFVLLAHDALLPPGAAAKVAAPRPPARSLRLPVQVWQQEFPFRRVLLGAMMGTVATLFRQTHVIWLAFSAGVAVVAALERHGVLQPPGAAHGSGAFVQIARFLRALVANAPALARVFWPVLALFALFAAFVAANGGVVLGDKARHEPAVHGAQLLYLSLPAAALCDPFGLWASLRHAAASRRRIALLGGAYVVAAAVCYFVVRTSTLLHPFLLADNRHFTFYFARHVLRASPLARFVLVPVYAAAVLAVLSEAVWSPGFGSPRLLVFAVAAVLTLVPAPLIEPRYFTAPLLLLHLHTGQSSAGRGVAWAQAALFLVVNAATTHLFLARPFVGADGHVARFMW